MIKVVRLRVVGWGGERVIQAAILILLRYKSALNRRFLFFFFFFFLICQFIKKLLQNYKIVFLYFEVDFNQFIGIVTISTSAKNKLIIIIMIIIKNKKIKEFNRVPQIDHGRKRIKQNKILFLLMLNNSFVVCLKNKTLCIYRFSLSSSSSPRFLWNIGEFRAKKYFREHHTPNTIHSF